MKPIDILGELDERLKLAPSVQAKWDALLHTFGQFGANQVNYGILDTFAAERIICPVRFLSSMDEGWLTFYGDERLDIHDPHVELARQGNLVPYYYGASALRTVEDSDQRETVAMTIEAGLASQLSVTFPDPLGAGPPVGGITIGSTLREAEYFRAIRGNEGLLIAAGLLFHHHCIGEVRRSLAGARPLSPRERDCMAYVAQGLRVTMIAAKLGVTEATVELHLRGARRKLNAATTGQAVARALMFGDIAV